MNTEYELYHRDIYFPETYLSKSKTLLGRLVQKLNWSFSKHIIDHVLCPDRKHKYTQEDLVLCLLNIDAENVDIFEIGVKKGWIDKICFRTPLDNEMDIIIVVMPCGKVKTAWLNEHSDVHCTLDERRYIRHA